MEALVEALKGVITVETLFTNLTALVPVIGGLIGFAFIYRIIRKVIKKASNGKAGI